MLTSGSNQRLNFTLLRFAALILFVLGLSASSSANAQTNTTTPTTINIGATAKLTNAKRMGIVLGEQDFYDSGQFMRNLAFMNPGFEAEIWQSTLHCIAVTATSCTDDNAYTYWPADFLKGASAEFIVGAATGATGTVTSSTAANLGVSGITVQFSGLSKAPAVGDYLVVRMQVPGNAGAGWWNQSYGGATFATDTTDLSPNTPGKQALQINATAAGQEATVSSYMDSVPGRSFIQLKGPYTLTFRAKGIGGANQVNISFGRAVDAPPAVTFFNQTVQLSNTWQDYSYTFQANDTGRVGTLALTFTINGSSMLLDDVALTAPAAANNPTVYRNEVVSTLQNLHPGVLRFMDSGTDWGSSIDNMIAVDFARQRAGYNNHNSESDAIPLSLHDYLVLCKTIGAEPWYTMPTGMSTQEMSNLMDYFGGSTSTVYGAKRAALGQTEPWTTVFPVIHLEFGNEVWNTSNPGANMTDAPSYGKRAGAIFAAAKASPSYSPKSFDLIQDGFEAVPAWTQAALATSSNYDSVDVAAYIFGDLNDTSSIENIFGPMFANPESVDSVPGGLMQQEAAVAASATPAAKLAIYEENMGTISGSASQAEVNSSIASLGAGLTTADNMLLMLRDLGITTQNMFALPGLNAPFSGTNGSDATTSPIWGMVIDMGGPTNLVRPTYLSEQLANSAILPNLLNTSQTGTNPTWNQPYTPNGDFSLNGAHYIQSFAFTDGTKLNVILFNFSRTSALPVNFAGLNAPSGAATISTLTAPVINATNETQQNVAITTTSQDLQAGSTLSLPPFSMTVVSVAAPVIPAAIDSLTVSCANSSLSPGQSTACSDQLVGQGPYTSAVNWSVDQGTISNTGVYNAPSTIPASGKATVTVTSVQDSTKTATFPIALATDSITGVKVTCPVTSLNQGTTTTCTATVTGTGGFSPAFNWSASAGSFSANGTYTAPATGTSVTLVATSTQDPTKSGQVTLTLTPKIILSSPVYTLNATSATFSWTVNMLTRNGINWGPTSQLTGGATPYDNNYLTNPSYTITGLQPNTTYYVLLVSYNSTGSSNMELVVTTPSQSSTVTGVTSACQATTLVQGGTTACTASVQGTGSFSSGVVWSASAGSISPTGAFTAPSSGTSVTVKATSVQDSTKSASTTIALTPASTITSVAVSCLANSLVQGGSTTCSAPVQGTGSFSSAVSWSASAGTISSAGVFTAPTTGTAATITATSTQDSTKSASTTIALTQPVTITSVSVACQAQSIMQGGSTACTAPVQGTGAFSPAVSWSASAGAIAPNGSLTAPMTGTAVTVKATSVQDPTKSASTTIALQPAISITSLSVSCQLSTLALNDPTSCAAAVQGTGAFSSAVTWSASAGTITPAGVFTAPSSGTAVTVKATSVQDPTKSASTTITLSSKPVISSPTSSVTATTATFSWSLNTPARNGVSWGLTPEYDGGATPYDNNFLTKPTYTITGLTPGTTYYILLTSYNNSGAVFNPMMIKTASQSSAISGVSISCTATELLTSTSTSCAAPVQGTGAYSSAVTWSASAGSISSTGSFTAPSTGATVTIKATSVQDPTKSASTTISVTPKIVISNATSSVTATTATFKWTVNTPTRNGISWGTTPNLDGGATPYDNSFLTNPGYTITGLKPGTTYYIMLTSYNDLGPGFYSMTITTPNQ